MASSSPTSPAHRPGDGLDPDSMPAHWLLARMGKQILRPGGRALTRDLLEHLDITDADDVVELAPGLGLTTRLVVDRRPQSYVGIEGDESAAARVSEMLDGQGHQCRVGRAEHTGLRDGSASVVFGEAFLTMQPEERKRQIVSEAFRILRPGGRYGLHELGLRPNYLENAIQDRIREDLSSTLRVGARPLTGASWLALVEDAGFRVVHKRSASMGLLTPRRLLDDEGLAGAGRLALNVLRHPPARRRVVAMRASFRRNGRHLFAISLVAVKPDASAP